MKLKNRNEEKGKRRSLLEDNLFDEQQKRELRRNGILSLTAHHFSGKYHLIH